MAKKKTKTIENETGERDDRISVNVDPNTKSLLLELKEEYQKLYSNEKVLKQNRLVNHSIIFFSMLIREILKIEKYSFNEINRKIGAIKEREFFLPDYREYLKKEISSLNISGAMLREVINQPEQLRECIGDVENAIKVLNNTALFFEEVKEKAERMVANLDVLHIEDDDRFVKVIKRSFERQGYKYKAVKTSLECYLELKTTTPRVFLVDIDLPGGIRGDELSKWIKSRSEYKDIPIYFMTAKTDFDKSCADHILPKPASQDDINQIIEYLEKKRV